MNKGADNRRRFPRRRFEAPVGIIFGGKYVVVPGFEISEGGLLIEAPQDGLKDTPVVVSFYVPGRDFVTVRGNIIYTKNTNTRFGNRKAIGIKFTNLQFREKRFIRDYIADKTTVEVPYI